MATADRDCDPTVHDTYADLADRDTPLARAAAWVARKVEGLADRVSRPRDCPDCGNPLG